ncbi:hypothetical protein [Helicobacter bilis]|uniref:Uncharacterized protein n=1 Tax=Helicobacter bilis TaxID=37372 RepID=A0A099V185_9HELI|nr:hypothetical protein [Helicobacter bilis]TLE08580.1 hypothetical protein LS79_009725 [Helicobacter bilis]
MAFPLIADKPQEASIDSNITESTKDQDEFTQALHDKALQEAFINYKNTNPQSQNTPLDTNNLMFADTQTKENITNTYNPQETQSQEELNHLQQATTPKLYRNTGISYFDRKEHLSLADAFLAKELGINLSYVNMDLNANVKKTDIGKAKNELAGLFADSKSLLDGVSHYEKTYLEQDSNTFLNSHAMASLGRKINDATNGFINLSNSANEKILSRNKMDAYTLASLMNGGAGKRTNQNINDAKAVIDNTWKGRENYYAGVVSGLENGMNYMNEKMSYMQNAGIPVSQSDSLKMYLLNELKKDLNTAQGKQPLSDSFERNRKALGVLNEKGDAGINEAIRLIQAK